MSRRRHRRMVATSTKNTSLVRRNQAKKLIVWSLRALAVVAVAIFLKLIATPPSNNNNAKKTNSAPTKMINYTLVETSTIHGEREFQRYKAVESDSGRSVSVERWTQLLASDGANADSLVDVLKVRLLA